MCQLQQIQIARHFPDHWQLQKFMLQSYKQQKSGLLSSLCQDPFKRGAVCHMRCRNRINLALRNNYSNFLNYCYPITPLLDCRTHALSVIFCGSQHTEFRSKVTNCGEEWNLVKLYQILILNNTLPLQQIFHTQRLKKSLLTTQLHLVHKSSGVCWICDFTCTNTTFDDWVQILKSGSKVPCACIIEV